MVYVVSRFAVPFMGWRGFKPPKEIPGEIKIKIAELEALAHNPQSYLQSVYDFVMEKNWTQWNHTRLRAAFRLRRAFVKDLGEIWRTRDFIYCTAINYLVYAMLTGSRYFKPSDIKVRHVFVNFFIHQYLRVKINGGWTDVDPAGTGIRGKPLGGHLEWFG